MDVSSEQDLRKEIGYLKNEIKKDINSADLKIDIILKSIQGDKFGNKGIIPRLDNHSERIEKLEDHKIYITGIVVAASSSSTLITTLIFWLLNIITI